MWLQHSGIALFNPRFFTVDWHKATAVQGGYGYGELTATGEELAVFAGPASVRARGST